MTSINIEILVIIKIIFYYAAINYLMFCMKGKIMAIFSKNNKDCQETMTTLLKHPSNHAFYDGY